MTEPAANGMCHVCGYARAPDGCTVCGGEGNVLGRRGELRPGRRNPVVEVLLGLDDVRRAVFALLFEREFVGRLRVPVAANALAMGVVILLGWLWLQPAYAQWFATSQARSEHHGPHLWLLATWLAAGPTLVDLLAGWAQDPIRRATEDHMLGASVKRTRGRHQHVMDRAQLLLVTGLALPVCMALVLVPWAGLPLAVVVGGVVAAVVWLQPPAAMRGLPLRRRLELLRRNPWRAFGTGLGLQVAVAVPFLNVLGLAPVATIAATSSFLHFEKRARRDPTAESPTAAPDAG